MQKAPAALLLSPTRPSLSTLDFAQFFSKVGSKDALDDELFHHYTTSTYITVGGNKALDVWGVEIPKLALQHPFLMRGLLAVTALHLADLNPQRHSRLAARASRYQNTALPLFRQVVSKVTEQNCHAIFAFSGFVIPYSLACLQSSGNANVIPSDDELLNWMCLIRGAHGLLYNNWNWLLRGPFAPLLERTKSPIEFSNNPDDGQLVMLLPLFLKSDSTSGDDQTPLNICRGAFDELRRIYALPYSQCRTVDKKAAVTIWPGTVSPAYIQLLRERRPEALVILAYYSVLLYQVPDCWYLRGLAERLLNSTYRCLSSDWRTLIKWPLEQLKQSIA
jgi:hypothetical protein